METDFIVDYKNVEDTVKRLLQILEGKEDLREGIVDTPLRVAKMYIDELCLGYRQDPEKILSVQFNKEKYDEIIIGSFPFFSLCEHHMLPFYGVAYIGYLPSNKITGLSKLGRLLDVYAKRLQLQERLTTEVVDALDKYLSPIGCGCVIKAQHLCAQMRGVKKEGSQYMTSALKGKFLSDKGLKEEFLSLVDKLKNL